MLKTFPRSRSGAPYYSACHAAETWLRTAGVPIQIGQHSLDCEPIGLRFGSQPVVGPWIHQAFAFDPVNETVAPNPLHGRISSANLRAGAPVVVELDDAAVAMYAPGLVGD